MIGMSLAECQCADAFKNYPMLPDRYPGIFFRSTRSAVEFLTLTNHCAVAPLLFFAIT
jgi:hypothetical protein